MMKNPNFCRTLLSPRSEATITEMELSLTLWGSVSCLWLGFKHAHDLPFMTACPMDFKL